MSSSSTIQAASASATEIDNDNHSKRIDQLYTDLIELDGKIDRCYRTFTTGVKELAYRYEMAITVDKTIDLPVGFIFDQIVTKMKNKGFSVETLNHVYKIFTNDEDMQKYRRKEGLPKPKDNSKEKNIQDNNIKMLVTKMHDDLESIKKGKALLQEYRDQYNPRLHNPSNDPHDYRAIRTDDAIIMGHNNNATAELHNALDVFQDNTNDPNQSLFESEDEYFNKKYSVIDPYDVPDVSLSPQQQQKQQDQQQQQEQDNNDNKIRVKDFSDKPIHTTFSRAYLENIKSRQRFYEMLLKNPIQNEEIDQRYAMLVDLDTRRRNMMTDDKSSHDLMQWIYILIERYEQSINSASSKSKVPGFITGKYRCTTREQITGKEVFLLKEALNTLNNREPLEVIEAIISKNIFKPRVAEFHNERHDNLSESSFGGL